MLQCFAYKYNKLQNSNRLLKTLLYKIENQNSSPLSQNRYTYFL